MKRQLVLDEASVALVAEQIELSRPEKCALLVWLLELGQIPGPYLVSELAHLLHEVGLSNQIKDYKRLTIQLQNLKGVLIKRGLGFGLSAIGRKDFDVKYGGQLRNRPIRTSHSIIDLDSLPSQKGICISLCKEANASYDAGHYNGAAVLLRRIIEGLLVDAFEAVGKRTLIESSGNLMMLDDVLRVVESGAGIKLSRGMSRHLVQIKAVGDKAAHSRTYLVKKPDIDMHLIHIRSAVAELVDHKYLKLSS